MKRPPTPPPDREIRDSSFNGVLALILFGAELLLLLFMILKVIHA